MVVGFFGLLRASEYIDKQPYGCTLRRKHVSLSADGRKATLHLTRSKTDVFEEGVDVVVHANDSALCPIKWIEYALASAPRRDPEAPLFQSSTGSAIKYGPYQKFIGSLCRLAHLVGGQVFSTHSLRIGGATTLIALGFDTAVVKLLGRWKSDAFQLYVRNNPEIYRTVSHSLAKAVVNATSASVTCGLPLDEFCTLHSSALDTLAPSACASRAPILHIVHAPPTTTR
jgi:hypothetical protein